MSLDKQLVEQFETQLAQLLKRIEDVGFSAKCIWADEYGGTQSVSMPFRVVVDVLD